MARRSWSSIARFAWDTFRVMLVYLSPAVVAMPLEMLVGKEPPMRPTLVATQVVGVILLLAAGSLVQRFVPVPSIAQIALAYLATCGGVAVVATLANVAILGWTD